jgi:hypothetical protein
MKKRSLLLAIVYLILAVVVVYAIVYTNGFGLINKKSANSGWQAVFLSNGQVYFGHLGSSDKQFAELSNIYYLQVDQQESLQPGKTTTAATTEQPKLTLIKLGNELHGPNDKMTINRDHILFIEDMKSDSKVVAAIEDYIKNPTK